MAWVPPKTDWASEDFFNFDDMNRVESNTGYLKELIEFLQGAFTIEEIKINRDMLSFDFDNNLNRIERNIDRLRQEFYAPIGWEVPRTDWEGGISKFSFNDANRLEKNLKVLYDFAMSTVDSLQYCGTFSCGEEGI